jgi:hypothetical protein
VALFGHRTYFDPRLLSGEKQTLIFRVTRSPSLRSGERTSGDHRCFQTASVSFPNRDNQRNSHVCGSVEDTLRPCRRSASGGRACSGVGNIGSEGMVVGTGSAVSPVFFLCLSAHIPVSRQACFSDRATWVVFLATHQARVVRMLDRLSRAFVHVAPVPKSFFSGRI